MNGWTDGWNEVTSTEDVFPIVAMVTDGGGRGTMTLATPQQSGSTCLLVKNPHLQGTFSIHSKAKVTKAPFEADEEKVCSSFYGPVRQTLMALSAPLVINSGSACRKLAAATAVLCACLC